jgi:hypothetical protein
MNRRSTVTTGLLLTLLAIASAQGVGAQDGWREIEQGRAVAPTAYLKVWNLTGSIRVVGWDRDSVAVTGRAQAGAGSFFFGGDRDAVKLGFEMQGKGSGELTVHVPARSTVWIKAASATVDVQGVTGGLDVYSVSGPIRIRGQLRQLYAESIGGSVEIEGSAAALRARTGSGSVVLVGGGDDVTLSTVEGALRISGAGIRRGRFETISGTLDFDGSVEKGASLFFQTHSGNAEIALPQTAVFDADVSTFEGELAGDLLTRATSRRDPLQGRGASVSRGSGGADVTVRSFSGDIVLRGR